MPQEYIASLIGLIATTQIHIAKGLQRFGIEGYSSRNSDSDEVKKKKRRLYVFSLILNNGAFLWVLIANMFAPPAAYTSMFGFGLIVLMFFSERYLGEPVGKTRHVGALILAAGTFFLGWAEGKASLNSGGMVMASINVKLVICIVGAFFVIALPALAMVKKYRASSGILGTIAGLITGVSGACDPLFKSIAQHYRGTSGLLPSTGIGWVLFACSIGFGTIAMVLTQVAFAWKAKATVIVPVHNMALILFPPFLLEITLSDYHLTLFHLPGIILIAVGMLFLFVSKR
jgi:hypothetical protein